MLKKRIEWVDMTKAIAILSMIAGHELNSAGLLATLIYCFHMPIFFILSGYTSHPITTWQEYSMKIWKSFKKIYLMAVVILFIQMVLANLIAHGSWSQMGQSFLKNWYWASNNEQVASVGVLWFLFAFFYGILVYDGISVLVRDYRYAGPIYTLLAFLGMAIASKIWLPQDLDLALVIPLFMWFGRWLKESRFIESKLFRYVLIISVVIWLLAGQQRFHIELSIRHYPGLFLSVLAALLSSLVVIYLAQGLLYLPYSSKLLVFGRHTLLLLCIHSLDLYWSWWGALVAGPMKLILRVLLDLMIFVIILGLHHLWQHQTK